MARSRAIEHEKFEVITLSESTLFPAGSNDPLLGLIQRSLITTPLADQSRSFRALEVKLSVTLCSLVSKGSTLAIEDICLVQDSTSETDFIYRAVYLGNGYAPDLNIANQIALGYVAERILLDQGLPMLEALLLFFEHKLRILHLLRNVSCR